METRQHEIISRYAQLPQMESYDLTLESTHGKGDVKVTLKKNGITFERTIKHNEDLSFISETFDYSNVFSPKSKMFSLDGLTNVHFDADGYLIAVHSNSTEKFRVNSDHREEVSKKLKASLGDKFHGLVK